MRNLRPSAVASFFILITLLVVPALSAQNRPYTPDKGSAERKAITDALRVPVERKLKQEVIFKIDHLKAQNNWAFLVGTPRRPDGGPIDYRNTAYAEAQKAGAFDDGVKISLGR